MRSTRLAFILLAPRLAVQAYEGSLDMCWSSSSREGKAPQAGCVDFKARGPILNMSELLHRAHHFPESLRCDRESGLPPH